MNTSGKNTSSLPPEDKSSKKSAQDFEAGLLNGRDAAINDFIRGTTNLYVFDKDRDFKDHYTLGFEVGYLRKLAEIAVF